MAYLDNTGEIIIDAILTKKGRERLAQGLGLDITQFALGDDEIDYELYEPAHPKGSAFYDAAIKAIPILEASPDETQVLRNKLVTLPKNTTRIPIVELGVDNIKVNQRSGEVSITPTTSPSGNRTRGYTAILADKSLGTIVGEGLDVEAGTVPVFLGDEVTTTAQVASGLEFRFIPNPNITRTKQTTLTVYGNETGGSVTIPITNNYVSDDPTS